MWACPHGIRQSRGAALDRFVVVCQDNRAAGLEHWTGDSPVIAGLLPSCPAPPAAGVTAAQGASWPAPATPSGRRREEPDKKRH